VKLAVAQLLPRAPDLVVSGINSGANVGINVLYSGTVAAAIEAAFLGLPAVAVSLYLRSDTPTDYARAAVLARRAIERMVEAGLGPGRVVSINIPALQPGEPPTGVKVCRQCTRPWVDTYERRTDPRGRAYYWNSSVFTLGDTEDDTDVAALRDKYVTITPLQFDLTHHVMLRDWREREWGSKGDG
jgi:5'-nucleotidase